MAKQAVYNPPIQGRFNGSSIVVYIWAVDGTDLLITSELPDGSGSGPIGWASADLVEWPRPYYRDEAGRRAEVAEMLHEHGERSFDRRYASD